MPSIDDIKQRFVVIGKDVKDVAIETWNVVDWPVQDFSAVVGIDPGWMAMLIITAKALVIGLAGASAYARRHGRA